MDVGRQRSLGRRPPGVVRMVSGGRSRHPPLFGLHEDGGISEDYNGYHICRTVFTTSWCLDGPEYGSLSYKMPDVGICVRNLEAVACEATVETLSVCAPALRRWLTFVSQHAEGSYPGECTGPVDYCAEGRLPPSSAQSGPPQKPTCWSCVRRCSMIRRAAISSWDFSPSKARTSRRKTSIPAGSG